MSGSKKNSKKKVGKKKTTTKKAASSENSVSREEFSKLENTVNTAVDSLCEVANQVADTNKTLTIFSKRFGHIFEPMEQQIGQDGVVTGENDTPELIVPKKEHINTSEGDVKNANLAFMEEDVIVHLHPIAGKTAPKQVPLWVNGKGIVVIPGKNHIIKRKYVEVLARAKQVTYGNVEYIDPQDGVRKIKWPTDTGLAYPFSVLEDKNPRGSGWLQSVLAQA